MSQDRRSPLFDQQAALGADVMWEDGWPWTMHYATGAEAEYEAIRTGTGLWDLFSTIKYEVRGPDAGRMIQRRYTNDLSSMQDGQVRYGAFVNPDGLMVDDGNVYRFGPDRYWVMVNTAGLENWFRGTGAGLDASIENVAETHPMIGVQGPASRDLLAGLTEADLGSLAWFRFLPEQVTVAGKPAWILRTGFSGELGFEVVTDAGSAPAIYDALLGAGGRPFGLDAVDMARIEAGLIIIAMDYQPGETSPYDVSMDRFVKPGTECVGAEALAAYGAAPPKRFKTLSIEGDAVPEIGAAVTADGATVGTVTSPTSTPRFGTLALAVLDAPAAAEGQVLEVGGAAATVGPLSIYDPEKKKPRG